MIDQKEFESFWKTKCPGLPWNRAMIYFGRLNRIKRIQSETCEHCPSGDIDTNAGEHSDVCLNMQFAIEKLERTLKRYNP